MSSKKNSIIKTLQNDILFAINIETREDLRAKYFVGAGAFTRNRKLPYLTTLSMMLRNDKRNLSLTTQTYFIDSLADNLSKAKEKLSVDEMVEGKEAVVNSAPTGSAFCQQRAKINPVLFRDWLRTIADNFYCDVPCVLWHGMILTSFDGSRVKVPATQDLVKQYGRNSDNSANEKPLSMMCVHYDVLNGVILDAAKGTARTAEQRLAYEILDDIVPKPYHELFLCDRAYTSFRLMWSIIEMGNYFVIRASKTRTLTIKEFYDSGADEATINIACSAKSHAEMVKKGMKLPCEATIQVRAIRYRLPNGDDEILLTNLPADEFPVKTIGELYPLRWGVETAIGFIKNEEQLEVCQGLTDTCFTQGFYISLILYSICSIVSMMDEEYVRNYNNEGHKYQYKINRNDCWPHMQRLIPLCFRNIDYIQFILYELADLFKCNLIPIRPGRHYRRNLRGTGKYVTFLNYKRAI